MDAPFQMHGVEGLQVVHKSTRFGQDRLEVHIDTGDETRVVHCYSPAGHEYKVRVTNGTIRFLSQATE